MGNITMMNVRSSSFEIGDVLKWREDGPGKYLALVVGRRCPTDEMGLVLGLEWRSVHDSEEEKPPVIKPVGDGIFYVKVHVCCLDTEDVEFVVLEHDDVREPIYSNDQYYADITYFKKY